MKYFALELVDECIDYPWLIAVGVLLRSAESVCFSLLFLSFPAKWNPLTEFYPTQIVSLFQAKTVIEQTIYHHLNRCTYVYIYTFR